MSPTADATRPRSTAPASSRPRLRMAPPPRPDATDPAEVTDLGTVRADRLIARRQRRAAARSRDLTALLRDRPDLAGVHAPADFAADGVSWCV